MPWDMRKGHCAVLDFLAQVVVAQYNMLAALVLNALADCNGALLVAEDRSGVTMVPRQVARLALCRGLERLLCKPSLGRGSNHDRLLTQGTSMTWSNKEPRPDASESYVQASTDRQNLPGTTQGCGMTHPAPEPLDQTIRPQPETAQPNSTLVPTQIP